MSPNDLFVIKSASAEAFVLNDLPVSYPRRHLQMAPAEYVSVLKKVLAQLRPQSALRGDLRTILKAFIDASKTKREGPFGQAALNAEYVAWLKLHLHEILHVDQEAARCFSLCAEGAKVRSGGQGRRKINRARQQVTC